MRIRLSFRFATVLLSLASPGDGDDGDGDELVVNGSTIHGYDPTTGKELWSLGPNSELVIATPVIGDGMAPSLLIALAEPADG